jgi:beta-lactamase regulating signal transducer with metallopeptidase domain
MTTDTSSPPLYISILSSIWIAGACILLLLVAIRHLVLAHSARRWPQFTDSEIVRLTRQAAQQVHVRLPRILKADRQTMPMVWCWLRPTLVLPATASAWPGEQLQAVLLHELAHIKRRDCLTQLIGQVACALYWFHPLAWFALGQMVRERERACDDLVLDARVRPSDYTTTLVAVVREYRQNRMLEPALPVARSSRLRERVQAILDNRQQRRLLGAHSALLLLALLAAGAFIAIIQPSPRAVAGQTALDRGNEPTAAHPKEHKVTVTVRDSSGHPLAGATVYLVAPMETQMYWISHPAGSAFEHGAVTRAHGTTDGEGRVTLQALLDLDALVIAASRYGIVPLRLVARAPNKGLSTLMLRLDQTEATMDLPPETLIEGTLKAPDGGPAKDVRVHVASIKFGQSDWLNHYSALHVPEYMPETITDAGGCFTVHGLSRSQLRIPLGLYWQMPRWPGDSKPNFKKDFALTKGRLIAGRITEEGNGRPVTGASVLYEPKPGNKFNKYTEYRQYSFRNSALTDAAGKFSVTGLPGPGFIIAEGPDSFARVKLPVSETRGNSDTFPEGYAAIDAPETGAIPAVEITFKRGLTLEARAVQPDGKPVSYVMVMCREQDESYGLSRHTRGRRFEAGLFQLTNCQPGKSYHVLFLQPELSLGAVVDLVADPKQTEPIEVKLQPTASLSGRVVNEDGTPARDVQAYTEISLMAGPATISPWHQIRGQDQWAIYTNLFGQEFYSQAHREERTDVKGAFRLSRLVPGANVYLIAAGKDFHAAHVVVPPLGPGASRDVGTLVLKKYKPGE